MVAGACLAIGIMQFVIWLKQTGERAHLAFSVIAVSVTAITICELMMALAHTPAEYGAILRWLHVPQFIAVILVLVFVRDYLRAGRLWLAYGAGVLQLLELILNFYFEPNLDYWAITGLQQIEIFGGGTASVAVGIASPWAGISVMSMLFLTLFVADAALTNLRRGGSVERRRSAVLGGSLVFTIVVTTVNSALIQAGILQSIHLYSIPLLAVIAAISLELSADVFRAAQLAAQLQKSDALLRNERHFLRQVIDIAPNLIFAKDRRGRFTLVNQAVADIYGTTIDALIGKTDADFNDNLGEVDAFCRADLEVMDTLQERLVPEERITDAAGKAHWMQTVKRPILETDGTANQVLGSATDITARKQAEAELGRMRNELAHFSRVTMLSELSGSLAHELNQPLTAILSNAQAALRFLARDNPNLDEAREILQDIVKDDKRAGEVIQGLRLLLKKGEMRKEPVDLNQVIREVLRLVHSDMLNSGVGLTTEFAPALPTVNGDRVQLQQVILNLVVNGCDAMAGTAAADRKLLVSTEPATADCILVSVADHGPGIPAEDLERVFDPFFTTKMQGLGLGLGVCRTIISAHGGRLWATNNAGSGTSFHFTLPANSSDTA